MTANGMMDRFIVLEESGDIISAPRGLILRHDRLSGGCTQTYFGSFGASDHGNSASPTPRPLAISADQQRLATIAGTYYVAMFDVESGAELWHYSLYPSRPIRCTFLNSEGELLVEGAVNDDYPLMLRLDIQTGALRSTTDDVLLWGEIRDFSDDGRFLILERANELLKISLPSGIQTLKFSSSWTGDDLLSAAKFGTFDDSPDGKFFAATVCWNCANPPTGRYEVVVWDYRTGIVEAVLESQYEAFTNIVFGPDSRTIFTMCETGEDTIAVQRWSLDAPESPVTIYTSLPWSRMGVFGDEGRYFTTEANGLVYVHRTNGGLHSATFAVPSVTLGSDWMTDDSYYHLSGEGRIQRRDSGDGRMLLSPTGEWLCGAASSSGRRIVAADDQHAYLYDTETMDLVAVGPPLPPRDPESPYHHLPPGIQFVPDSDSRIYYHDDTRVYLIDVVAGEVLGEVGQPVDLIKDVQVTPDGSRMAIAANSPSLQVIEIATGEEVTPPGTNFGRIDHVAWRSNNVELFAINNDPDVRLWDVETAYLVVEWAPGEFTSLNARPASIGVSDNGRWLMISSNNGEIFTYDLRDGLDPMNFRAGVDLTRPAPMPFVDARMSPSGRAIYAVTPYENGIVAWPGPEQFDISAQGITVR